MTAGLVKVGRYEAAYELCGRYVELFIVDSSGETVQRVHIRASLLFLLVIRVFVSWAISTRMGVRTWQDERKALRRIFGG